MGGEPAGDGKEEVCDTGLGTCPIIIIVVVGVSHRRVFGRDEFSEGPRKSLVNFHSPSPKRDTGNYYRIIRWRGGEGRRRWFSSV